MILPSAICFDVVVVRIPEKKVDIITHIMNTKLQRNAVIYSSN